MNAPDPEAGPAAAEFVYSQYQPTPYDLGITDDLNATWPPPVNGIRPSKEVVAAHFGYASVAEMETAREAALDADADAEVEAQLEREAEL